MICKNCSIHKGSFSTESVFLDFKKKLSAMTEEGYLKKLNQIDSVGPFIKWKYECCLCNQKWVLSYPDQAFRGGWEKVDNED